MKRVIDTCFAGTPSRIKGVGFEVLAQEATDAINSAIRHGIKTGMRSFPIPEYSTGANRVNGTPGIRTISPIYKSRLEPEMPRHTAASPNASTVRPIRSVTCEAFSSLKPLNRFVSKK